ncbi:MAG: methionine gamma-lyase family protein [Clostridiales bacterium]|nr:methionine gamma-lyase family protein [Clostridiales bacterium]
MSITKIDKETFRQACRAAADDMEEFGGLSREIAEKNLVRVLDCFRRERIGSHHFGAGSGYGYNDEGRDRLESLYALVFATEAALVRQQIISGTHAISLALFGNLLPGDELLSLGMPYDTLLKVIGKDDPPHPGSLRELGIDWRVLEFDFTAPDPELVAAAIGPRTKILAIQRSRGYSLRPALSVAQIGKICQIVKDKHPQVIVFVDNCYGEFVEEKEPSQCGADLLAGSLIKNIGAGIAPGGGYIAGRADLVERAAYRLTVPGVGREMGASLISNRLYYQALFLAPSIVAEAVQGVIFAASLLERLGFGVTPAANEQRSDIVQAILLGQAEDLIAFCQGIQRYSPVDSFAVPEAWPMPGYSNEIIMAAGCFVQGSSIELSADGPIRPPYTVFLQGGLSRYHTKYAVIRAIEDIFVS